MTKIVSICYLDNFQPIFSIPQKISKYLTLCETNSLKPLSSISNKIHNECTYCLKLENYEERISLNLFQAFFYSLLISSDCSIKIKGYDFLTTGYMSSRFDSFLWGHHLKELNEDDFEFAKKHHHKLTEYILTEKFNRIANSLRLHSNSLRIHISDLALLGFVASLESLFSISPQELSFRLSLIVSKFIGVDKKQQKDLFKKMKDLYIVRSKLVHGDKICSDEEQAATQLSEYWTPLAENINRNCIKFLISFELFDIFSSNKLLEAFLSDLYFSKNSNESIRNIRSKLV